jgi:hypothetical protein
MRSSQRASKRENLKAANGIGPGVGLTATEILENRAQLAKKMRKTEDKFLKPIIDRVYAIAKKYA